jgi:predicted Zn-dependent protease
MEKTFGVRATILNPGPAIPKTEPFYDKTRGQYNSDILVKSVEQSSATYGQSVRFLYVVDLKLASFSEWAPAPSWARANSGSNAALLSIYDFHKDGNGKETSKDVLLERAEKSAMRALGITVGFDASPSVADASCIMHPTLIMEELDNQKNVFCSPELEALAQIFQK